MSSGDKKNEGISDIIKRVVSIGVGSAFMTEEAVRKILDDLPLPKDIVTGLIANAKNAKGEFVEGIREEIRAYLAKVDPEQLVDRVIQKYDIEVEARLKFSPKSSAKETQSESKSESKKSK